MGRPKLAKQADVFYIAMNGNDNWSGTLDAPTAAGSDGPWASVGHAQQQIRHRKSQGLISHTATVYIREGVYTLTAPLRFGPEDSGPITWAAYPGETPVFSGGEVITGWQETAVHGCSAWITEIPDVLLGKWNFRQLWVNGRRAERPRWPKQGMLHVESAPGMPVPNGWGGGHFDRFKVRHGDIKHWHNLEDVELVLFHFWIDERFHITDFDEDTDMVSVSPPSMAPLTEGYDEKMAPYYVENVFEELKGPGQWYLDRKAGKLYYLPQKDETIENTEIIAPRTAQLLCVAGDPDANAPVDWLRFEGLTFAHSAWVQPGERDIPGLTGREAGRSYDAFRGVDYASGSQAAATVPGAVYLRNAKHVTLEDCTIEHVGWYGLELDDGCTANRIVGNTINDMGAGGIKLNGATTEEPAVWRTGNNIIEDNTIHAGGKVFPAGVGILSMHSFGNSFSHNHIYDLYYTGISVGWEWGYAPSISQNNRIEKNHIHTLGQGKLSDMGGIYTLGVAPGTVVRGNLIYDVVKLNYGGWGIYPDEGSAHIIIENNIAYGTNGEAFHEHYGRENVVRNNIFGLSEEAALALSRPEPHHVSLNFERNIFLVNDQPVFRGPTMGEKGIRSDLNLFWDISGKPLCFTTRRGDTAVDFAGWQSFGHDQHGLVADPGFADPLNGNFSLSEDSIAVRELGFKPIDMSDVGPRR